MKICEITGCEKRVFSRYWCQTHYGRWYRTGDPAIAVHEYDTWDEFTTSNLNTNGEWAWAAGFFDGEGSTTLTQNSPRVTISQHHPEVLERFRAAVGIGKVYGPYKKGATGKFFWGYAVCGKPTVVLLGEIWPWLGTLKKEQAVTVLEQWNPRKPGRKRIMV